MRILVAEDQPTCAQFLRRVLEHLGHEVDLVPDGEAAWQAIAETEANLLISDWVMPRLDGLELCRRIRAARLNHYIYIILLTAKDRREDLIAGLRAGADDFLTKPPDHDELAVRLEVAARILAVHAELARKNAVLESLAVTDALTTLANRRAFDAELSREVAVANRTGALLSLIMLDVDFFKRYNDDFGHPAGDEVLRAVGNAIRASIRGTDVAARYGGEEFAVLLPRTDMSSAVRVGERIRIEIATNSNLLRRVTASLGVATLAPGGDLASLVNQADKALYRAKQTGRDRVLHYDWLDDLKPTEATSNHDALSSTTSSSGWQI